MRKWQSLLGINCHRSHYQASELVGFAKVNSRQREGRIGREGCESNFPFTRDRKAP